MQRAPKKQTIKRIILTTILAFICSYFIFLILWIQVKDYYGYGITFVASEAAPFAVGVRFEGIKEKGGLIQPTFSRRVKRGAEILIDVPIHTSYYTFNVPLTFAIITALFPFIRRRGRANAEALLILLGVHFLYVFSLETDYLTTFFFTRGFPGVGETSLYAYQFLWQFTKNMVIRFEPFLIGFYMFIRFRK